MIIGEGGGHPLPALRKEAGHRAQLYVRKRKKQREAIAHAEEETLVTPRTGGDISRDESLDGGEKLTII